MRYLLALLFPPFALLACGRPIQATLNFICLLAGFILGAMILLVGAFVTVPLAWTSASIHALLVVNQEQNDERHRQLLSVISKVEIPRVRPEVTAVTWLTGLAMMGTVVLCLIGWWWGANVIAQQKLNKPVAVPVAAYPVPKAVPELPAIMGWTMTKVIAAYGEPANKDKTTGLAHWPTFYARFENGIVTETQASKP